MNSLKQFGIFFCSYALICILVFFIYGLFFALPLSNVILEVNEVVQNNQQEFYALDSNLVGFVQLQEELQPLYQRMLFLLFSLFFISYLIWASIGYVLRRKEVVFKKYLMWSASWFVVFVLFFYLLLKYMAWRVAFSFALDVVMLILGVILYGIWYYFFHMTLYKKFDKSRLIFFGYGILLLGILIWAIQPTWIISFLLLLIAASAASTWSVR